MTLAGVLGLVVVAVAGACIVLGVAGRPLATLNALGFRGPEPSPARGYRALLVGDSFAGTGPRRQVLNLGGPGYGVQQMIQLVETGGRLYQPTSSSWS